MSYTGMCKDGAIQAATFVSGAKILEKLDISGNDIGLQADNFSLLIFTKVMMDVVQWLLHSYKRAL